MYLDVCAVMACSWSYCFSAVYSTIKRSVVRGNSASELAKNIQAIDWDKVAEEVSPKAGGKIDFGV